MARDERKRQKKLERKRAKRQEGLAHKERRNVLGWPIEATAASPVLECWLDPNLFDSGMGQAVVARQLPNGRLAVGTFLLDVYCLGIKNAFASLMMPSELRAQVTKMKQAQDLVQKDAGYVTKLIVGLEAWARAIGFEPHPDYHDAKKALAGIGTESCSESFAFGKEGKPLFINGPFDRPFRVNQIVQTLLRTCGEGNFDFVCVGGELSSDDELADDDFDE